MHSHTQRHLRFETGRTLGWTMRNQQEGFFFTKWKAQFAGNYRVFISESIQNFKEDGYSQTISFKD